MHAKQKYEPFQIRQAIRDLQPEIEQLVHEVDRQEKLAVLSANTGIAPGELMLLLAHGAGLELLTHFELDSDALATFPARLIHGGHVLPILPPDGAAGGESNVLCLATLWPPDERIARWVYAVCGCEAHWYLVDPERLLRTISIHFGVGAGSLEPDSDALELIRENDDEEDESAAIIRFVNEVVQQAMRDRATDIHFEPRKESLQIRYRIDGKLVPVHVPPNLLAFQSAIISRIKIMSRMNISEKRRPQDGRITYGRGRQEVDVRVSTLPTMYGESVSMRLLNEQSQPTSIQDLGFLPDDERRVNQVLDLPHGILLITGPTGSGKSTTLAAFMRQIATPDRRIITVEDPIEYEIPQVNQTQVNHEIGLSFASALRSVLRQDPDVIMVGEIRDRDTADIAIRASLTGHLVLSTLHTNDAPGAIVRLADMGIEPFLIASSVKLVIAQRLIRRLCPACATADTIEPAMLRSCMMTLGISVPARFEPPEIMAPVGCEACSNLGFRGRIGMFELLTVSEGIHTQIVQQASAHAIRRLALQEGMRSLQRCGWEHVLAGRTALAEVMRYADAGDEQSGEPEAEG